MDIVRPQVRSARPGGIPARPLAAPSALPMPPVERSLAGLGRGVPTGYSPPTSKGFGSRLIERSLAAEFAGRTAIDYRPEGVVCSIEADLSS